LLVDDPDEAYEYADRMVDADPDDVPAQLSRCLDTDKSWDGLNFLLTRHGGAPVDVIHGGTYLTTDEWGYDPPRYLSPAEVDDAGRFLRATPFATLAAHFDPAAMTDVYPATWDEDDAADYLDFWYRAMTVFFTTAAEAGDGMLVYLM